IRTRSGKCVSMRAVWDGSGPCEFGVMTSHARSKPCRGSDESYVMVEHGSGKGTSHRPPPPCGPPRWRHLPPTVRTLWQSLVQEVPACWTRPRPVLVRFLLGLSAAHAQLLRRQATPRWRRIADGAGARSVDRYERTHRPLGSAAASNKHRLSNSAWSAP